MRRSRISPAVQALVEKLTPVAESYPGLRLDADELRYRAENNSNINLNTEKPSIVSAAITRALRAAGFKPTDETVRSLAPLARSRRVLVWARA